MANVFNRASYYANSLRRWPFARNFACPNCGGPPGETVDRKYLVTSLAHCPRCRLLFRQPTDPPAQTERFYLSEYVTDNTATPADRDPRTYESIGVLRRFRDCSPQIEVLRGLGLAPGTRLLDYGCSWGYGAAQLRHAGFSVTGYEMAPAQRRFAAEVLGLPVIDDFEAFAADPANLETFDVIYASHVLEHVPAVDALLARMRPLVRSGGYLAFFVPNGSDAFRRADPGRWRRLWGEVHPLFLTEHFFQRAFADRPLLVGAMPLPAAEVRRFVAGQGTVVAPLAGKELAAIVWM